MFRFMFKSLTYPILLSSLLVSSLANAAWQNTSTANSVIFKAIGPAGFSFEGKTEELSLSETPTDYIITVPLASLKTGISLRDKHMKEKYLEVPKFPKAEFIVSKTALQLQPGNAQKIEVQGIMKVHGQTKSIPANIQLTPKDTGFIVESKLRININDYGIKVPNYLGVTVKPDIDINVRFIAVASQIEKSQ